MNHGAPIVSIVDDDASVLRGLARLLRACGYQVRTFTSATEFLQQVSIDGACAVVDVHMPGVTGLELVAQLTLAKSTLPVVLITGHADPGLRSRAMAAGAFGLVEKPFLDSELLEVISAAIAPDDGQLHVKP